MISSFKSVFHLHRLVGVQLIWEPALMFGPVQQSVRWRKMRHVPKASSKKGHIRIPTPIDPKEYIFLQKKYPQYRLMMSSLRDYFQGEVKRRKEETAEGISKEVQQREEEAEWQKLLVWNEEENKRTRLTREARIAEERRLREEEKLEILVQMEEQKAEKLKEMTELVRREKEASKTFITLENMDEAIEASLGEVKNYNFTMDRRGNVTLPEDTAWLDFKKKWKPKKK